MTFRALRRLGIAALLAGLALAAAPFAAAQQYPFTNPTYIPTAQAPATTLTAAGNVEFVTNGIAALSARITGTRDALSGTFQGTNDGTNWSNLQLIPVGGGAVATTVTANGFWFVNSAGFTKVRFHAATLTNGTAIAQFAGTLSPNAIYVMNPQAITGPLGIIGTDGMSTLDCAADGSCEVNLTRVAGAAIAQGHGTAATAVRVELPTDGTGTVGLIAGSALVGKVGFDQTTDGTTNKVYVGNHLNADTAALSTFAATAASTVDSADQTNLYGKCLNAVVDLTTTTTATVTTTIQGKDAASGKYYTLLAGAAKTANGTTLMTVCPGSTAAANTVANFPLPKVWRVETVIADNVGTAAVTGTIGASVIQ